MTERRRRRRRRVDDYDFWDWARGTDSSILSLKAHRFVKWNQRQAVILISVVIRLRQIEKRSVSRFSLQTRVKFLK